ncbi:MAG: TonB-dependent receptor [Prevotella sp.]|nr:TonB-dependent receptor [Prevotella sp.]
MLKRLLISIVLLAGAISLQAQHATLSGRIVGGDEKEALEKATVQLLTADTTFVKGTFTDEQGSFTLSSLQAGKFLLKVSNLGYKTVIQAVSLQRDKALHLGDVMLKPDAIVLDEANVTANIPKMVIKDDTIVYNADAFRVPEGSVIEALVEALPGAKIDDNGGITINGKSVKRFKMDGRDYMTGNTETAMKNLPSYLIEKVKAYDEKSDLSRYTGIDDGNEDFVLDFQTRRGMRNGLIMNPDLGYGTDNRYGIRLTAMKPLGAMRYTFMGNANNVNGRNFTGRGGRGRGNNNGQQHTKSTALDVSYEDRDQVLRLNGRVTWDHNNTDNWTKTGSENFVNTRGGAFSNSINQSYSRRNSWTGNMNLQWKIDSVTNLSFRPNLSFSTGDQRGYSTSASFNANPFDYVDDALSDQSLMTMNDLDLIVNSRHNKSLSYNSNKNVSSNLQLYRRLNNRGRNVALSSSFNYRDGKNQSANLSSVHLYQVADRFGNDSTYQTNRYNTGPSNNWGYSFGVTYTEPIFGNAAPVNAGRGGRGGQRGPMSPAAEETSSTPSLFLQTNYRFNYSHQKNDPSTYDFPDYADEALLQMLNDYREWTALFGYLDNPYESYLSERLSRYSERTEYGHNIDLQLRLVHAKYNMNVGVSAQPQRSHYIQQYLGYPVDTVRTVVNVSPTLNLRYRFDKVTNLQVNYRGSSSQPSITDLLDIYDDTNPLSIRMGNPGLKPSFTNTLSANFQTQRKQVLQEDSLGFQVPKAQRHWSFTTNANFSRTSNSIGNVTTYNEATGGSITKPENINGNWNARLGTSFNLGLDTLNRWDFSGRIDGSYNHHIAYVNLNRTATPDRNVTHTYNINPSVSLSYRVRKFNFSINSSTSFAHTENRLQASRNLSTWNFNYGGNLGATLPWGSEISTDAHMYSKRGYSDPTLNTNEFIWNAQLSHGFLRGKKLTVMLQWYDILNQQSNFTRDVRANGWTDREVNTLTSYAMLHVTYRLNLFGGGAGRGGERGEGRGFNRGEGGRGPRGGFGGQRGGGPPMGF